MPVERGASRFIPPFLTGESAGLLALIVFASLLLFARLGNQLLWQDEAQTALIAETVMRHGVPLGYDGKNYFSQEAGADYGGHYLWRYHPWLQFYLTAGSFELFGKGTFTARLPFALLGLGAIALVFFFAKRLSKSMRVGFISCGFLSLCVPFLLLSRQCRYYSAGAFFTLLGLHAYLRLIDGKRGSAGLLILAATLLFYSHYLYYGVLLGAILSHLALFHRPLLKSGVKIAALTLPFTLPGILWHRTMPYGSLYTLGYRDPALALGMFLWLLRDISRYILPPTMMILALAVLLVASARKNRLLSDFRKGSESWLLLALWMAWNLAALSLFSTEYYFRYLAPAIPILCVAAAWIVNGVMRVNRYPGSIALLMFFVHQPLRNYLYEITHDYVGPMDGYVLYLNRHAKPTDVVWATLEDLPLKFYTDLRVVGSLTGEDLSKAPPADWLILRRFATNADDVAARAFIKQHLLRKQYQEIRLPYPDITFQNREDPERHKYKTVTDAPPIILFRRISS